MNRVASFNLGGSSRLGLLLALLLAVLTGVLVFAALQSSDSGGGGVASQTGGGETLVVTAAQDIPARTEITSEMVRVSRVPENALLGGAFATQDLVVGRVARIPIFQGEQLVQGKLASDRTDLGLSYIVPEGQRALAVGVNKVISPGGLVRPGDRVDVVAVIDITHEDLETGREATVTRSLLVAQNIEILAVEQALENRPVSPDQEAGSGTTTDTTTTGDGTLVEQPEADPDGTVVTLALAPTDMQNLMLADERGSIRLAVRAPGDETIVDVEEAGLINLTSEEFRTFLLELLAQPEEDGQ